MPPPPLVSCPNKCCALTVSVTLPPTRRAAVVTKAMMPFILQLPAPGAESLLLVHSDSRLQGRLAAPAAQPSRAKAPILEAVGIIVSESPEAVSRWTSKTKLTLIAAGSSPFDSDTEVCSLSILPTSSSFPMLLRPSSLYR